MSVKALHIIGGGLAGLACALRAREKGVAVFLYEASPYFGGRCRSFVDPDLGMIDSGSHLMLSANTALQQYIRRSHAEGQIITGPACFPFVDLRTGERWNLAPNHGRIPWWLFLSERRCPDGSLWDHLQLFRLRWAKPQQTVADLFAHSPLYQRLIAPLTVAILNTEPEAASACLLWRVIAQTLVRGGDACQPLFTVGGLSAALVDPAVERLEAEGACLLRQTPIKALQKNDEGRIFALQTRTQTIPIADDERVIAAIPPQALARLLPDLAALSTLPSRRIMNAHFALPPTVRDRVPPLLGMVGGKGEWLFYRDGVLSVTISAAPPSSSNVLEDLWREAVQALGLPVGQPCPPGRLISHHAATLAQTPAAEQARAGIAQYPIILAGDWTHSALPCTIEAAIQSGNSAAERALD